MNTGKIDAEKKGKEVMQQQLIGRKESEMKSTEEKKEPEIWKTISPELILETMIDPIGVIDLEGRVITTNKAMNELAGFEETRIGEPSIKYIAERDRERALGAMRECIKKGSFRDRVLTFLAADGKETPVAFTGTLLKYPDGSPKAVIVAARDVQELKLIRGLESVKKELDSKLKKLEEYEEVTVKRELKMMELEEEIEELKKELKSKRKSHGKTR